MLGRKLPSPEYAATIECDPADSELVVMLAWADPDSGCVPTGVPSTLNATVPVGVPAPGGTGATVAVNVTAWPKVCEPAGLALSVVVVASLFTV